MADGSSTLHLTLWDAGSISGVLRLNDKPTIDGKFGDEIQ